jgi:hypothetical protein
MNGKLYFYLLVGLAAPSVSLADDLTQSQAQNQADLLYRQASDQSLQNSVVNAMRAMTALGQGSYVNAYRVGTTAYGEWDNSKSLDQASRDAFAARGSLGDGSQPGTPPPAQTSFRRLDPAFLYQGDAGRAAADFEKATGIKRETFLRRMSEASDNPIAATDPRLVSKYIDRLDGLTRDIPDPKVKATFHKTLRAIPVGWLDLGASAVRGAIAAAAHATSGFTLAKPAAPKPDLAAAPVAAVAFERMPAASTPVVEASAPPKKPSDISGSVVSNGFMSEILLAQSSQNATDDEDTLFQRVRHRYQLVTARIQ